MIKNIVRKCLNRFKKHKTVAIEKCHFDRMVQFTLQDHEKQVHIAVHGWYHNKNVIQAPKLVIVCDGLVLGSVRLVVSRPDVQDVYGSTDYLNGFEEFVTISANSKKIIILNESNQAILLTQKITDIPFASEDQFNQKLEQWLSKMPFKIRKEIAEKYQNKGFLSGYYANDGMMRDLLKYLSRPNQQEDGYNIVSYVSGVFGVAEAGRAFIDYQFELGKQFALFDYFEHTHDTLTKEEEGKYKKRYFKPLVYNTNVFLIDVQCAVKILKELPELAENRKNITSFWWEFETGFEHKVSALNLFDEVLVFSEFIKDILMKVENRTFAVTKIKYPFYKKWEIQDGPQSIRRRFGLGNKFCFFFNFDYFSSYNRKNPLASLEAFFQEFRNEENALFIYKTNGMDHFNDKAAHFNRTIKKLGLNGRVIIIDEMLSKNEFMSLLNAMDCYVSLHRGEGLGLGILEAFALGIPVIATNYGGNTEYMDHPLAHPVDYTMVPANDDYVEYKHVKTWAEPDVVHAGKLMKEMYLKHSRPENGIS